MTNFEKGRKQIESFCVFSFSFFVFFLLFSFYIFYTTVFSFFLSYYFSFDTFSIFEELFISNFFFFKLTLLCFLFLIKDLFSIFEIGHFFKNPSIFVMEIFRWFLRSWNAMLHLCGGVEQWSGWTPCSWLCTGCLKL